MSKNESEIEETNESTTIYANAASERAAKWNKDNKERRKEISRAYSEKHRLEIKKYREDNRAMYTKLHREWRQIPENRLKVRAWTKSWADRHPVEMRLFVNSRRAKTRGIKIAKEDICNWESRVCGICNRIIEGKFDIDHIIPLSRGGEHKVPNLQLAHPTCNTKKHNKMPHELAALGVF